jgi:asparagine synthase (glutamine-hydrolysing)
MSVQFGRWSFEGQPPAPDYIEKVSATLAPYGPDSNESYSKGGITILYRAFYTTNEAHHEKQPCICPSGAVITWDGRLDNRADLISELRDSLTVNSTDVAIVAVAYEKWGANCMGKLIGDWALSIWNPINRSLLLAKDPIGTRHLYYSIENNQVTWSTILDPLVRFAGRTFALNEEYIAGWLATLFPAAHLTPYAGVDSVPPSSCVVLRPGKHIVSKNWDFDPEKKIRYRTDAEYEEHFRTVFAKAVQRRLRSDRPVLAELSGGMDSSSIVCMADIVIARGASEIPCLDTVTWYDDSNPNWGERAYFTKVEEKRGRTGWHIDAGSLRDVGSPRSFSSDFQIDHFVATPVPNTRPSELFKQQGAYMLLQGHRVTLSGIGGGEVTGDGVPTPTPELQNLLAKARFFTLAHQLKLWAAKMRKRRLPLLWEAIRQFSPLALLDVPDYVNAAAPWFCPQFVRRNRAALRDYPSRVKLFGPLPSFQHNLRTLDADRKLLAWHGLQREMLHEARYPYFDRDFLEFMYAIPREQIVRVGQRRSLMKRALLGIVPDEVLNRRRKETVPQEASNTISPEWPSLLDIGDHVVSSSVRIVDINRFLEALQKARQNEVVPTCILSRTITLESWLRHLTVHRVLTEPDAQERSKNTPVIRGEAEESLLAVPGRSTRSTGSPHEFS